MTQDFPTKAEIFEALQQIRAFLEPKWRDWRASNESHRGDPGVVSFRMCGFSSLFLREALMADFPAGAWAVKGGCSSFHPADPGWTGDGERGRGGMVDAAGAWHDHYWVTGTCIDGPVILDLTADQFGHDPIIVTDKGDSRYLRNWRDSHVRRHMDGVKTRVGVWMSEWQMDLEENESLALGM